MPPTMKVYRLKEEYLWLFKNLSAGQPLPLGEAVREGPSSRKSFVSEEQAHRRTGRDGRAGAGRVRGGRRHGLTYQEKP